MPRNENRATAVDENRTTRRITNFETPTATTVVNEGISRLLVDHQRNVRHVAKNNPTKPHSQPADQKYVTADEPESTGDEECLPLFTVGGGTTPPIKVPLIINDASITMELDTGAAVTIISEKDFKQFFENTPLSKSELLLKTYSGDRLTVLGTINAVVLYEQQTQELPLTVVAGDGPSLLGRDWLQHLTLNWKKINTVSKHASGNLE